MFKVISNSGERFGLKFIPNKSAISRIIQEFSSEPVSFRSNPYNIINHIRLKTVENQFDSILDSNPNESGS